MDSSKNLIDQLEANQEKIEKLKEEVVRLNAVIDNIPASIYWKDKNGVYLGQNLYASKKMQSVEFYAGSSSEAVVNKTDYDLFPKESADQYRKNDIEVMTKGIELSLEESVTIPSGKVLTQLSTKKPLLNEKNEVIGIVGITLDITDQKEAQALKVEREFLQRQLETTKTLAATIAHELRTPLGSINLAADGTKHYLADLIQVYNLAKNANLPIPKIRSSQFKILVSALDDIKEEANYSNAIINMLLVNVEQQNIKPSELQMCSMVHCITEALRRYPFQPGEKELVHWKCKNDFLFMGKEMLTIHILFNLLKNAIYYIKDAGKGDIHIELQKETIFNKLYFRDTGKGISAKVLPNIFDLFFTKTYHGTGIGLAFCKMIMQSYGGSIECKSSEGEFTEFILSFPIILKQNIKS